MRQAIANLTGDQNGAPASSASGVPQLVVSGPPGRGTFPANYSLYLLSDSYPLQNTSELQIDPPYIEINWDVFSRSDSSIHPGSKEDSRDAPETIPTRAKDSLKFSKNRRPSSKRKSSSVTKGGRFPPNLSQNNKVTDIPSKKSFEMVKDSRHIVNETRINHIIKIQPERTSEDSGTAYSRGAVELTATTYRDGRAMFNILGCILECHVYDNADSSTPQCVVDMQCCQDRYSNGLYLDCLKGMKLVNAYSSE